MYYKSREVSTATRDRSHIVAIMSVEFADPASAQSKQLVIRVPACCAKRALRTRSGQFEQLALSALAPFPPPVNSALNRAVSEPSSWTCRRTIRGRDGGTTELADSTTDAAEHRAQEIRRHLWSKGLRSLRPDSTDAPGSRAGVAMPWGFESSPFRTRLRSPDT